jgi:hypothetical protein
MLLFEQLLRFELNNLKFAAFTPHDNENLSTEQCLNQEKGLP